MGRWKRKAPPHKKHSSKTQVEDQRQTTSEETNNGAGEDKTSAPEAKPAADASVLDKHRKFNAFDQERIYAYLAEYKCLAELHYRPSSPSSSSSPDLESAPIAVSASYCSGDSGSDTGSNHDGENDDATVKTTNTTFTGKMTVAAVMEGGGDGKSFADEDTNGINIAGHLFPLFSIDEVSSKPYLMLPRTLGKNQRRCVHELCVEGKFIQASFQNQLSYIFL